MCGRYSIVRGDRIVKIIPNVTVPVNLRLVARFNAAPTQLLPVFTNDSCEVQLLRWGLIPSWAKEEAIGNKLINARAETLAEKPAFREALKHRRCVIPADGFYEWRKNTDGTKTPMYIRRRDGDLFAFAGLWDIWRNATGELIKSFAVITTAPNALIKPIHDRMPAIIPEGKYLDWLAKGSTDLLNSFPADQMHMWPVTPHINSPGNEGPELIEPVSDTQPRGLFD